MKRTTLRFQKLLFGWGMGLVLTSTVVAQNNKALAAISGIEKHMSATQRQVVSAGGENMLHVARNFSGMKHIAPTAAVQQKARLMAVAPKRPIVARKPGAPVPINDPQLDLQLSRLAGFTQSETSSAWCGSSVVTGYNDSSAFLMTAGTTNGGVSFSGVSVSNDSGKSFRDLGTLNPGSDNTVFLGGDPSVVCSNQSTFYYTSLLSAADADGNSLTGVAINTSTDGGNTWSTPAPAVLKDSLGHFVDKEWLTIDRNNPQRLYVTYTDFDDSVEAHQGCAFGISLPRVAIELVTSDDGGRTWSAPTVVHEVHCHPAEADQGSQVIVGPKGDVYVSFIHRLPESIELLFRRSDDHGATFQPAVTIANSDFPGIFQGFTQDFFRINSFPSLAVDLSNTSSRGSLYLTWVGPSGSIFDFPSFTGLYNFGGVFLTRSNDGGNSWTTPALVSPFLPQFKGPGRDQFFPSAAVDGSGTLAVCYYDRRNDPTNNAMDRYCSYSNDRGSSFTDIRETTSSWLPTHDADLVINTTYMGDYDTVVSDATGQSRGFFDSFQVQTGMNPDVVGVRRQAIGDN